MKYNRLFVLMLPLLCIALACNGQEVSPSTQVLETRIDSLINATMEAEHIPGAAFIIIKDGKTLLKKGYGFTSLGEEIRRVDPDSTIFRIGSITKTFTATALMQLVDDQKVNLKTNVNNYLTSLQVPNTFQSIVTSEHLLNHSAGFDELRGRVVYDRNESIPLGDYLETRLVRIRESGLVNSYSSFGIALAGLLVEDVSGMTLEAYMKQRIWEPLGMNMTSMFLNDQVEEYASWGYEYRNGVNVPQPWEYYHTYPASEINSTVTDMAKFMQMHLNNGTFNNTRILKESTAIKMKTPPLRVHPEVESFGLGFYEDEAQGLTTISHGGDMLGYSGYMAMVPEMNLGIYVVHHHEGTRLRYNVMNLILEHFNPGYEIKMVNESTVKTDLSKFQGSYQWTTYCHSCENSWRPNVEALVLNDDHSFTFIGRQYFQVGSMLFKSADGTRTMGFKENEAGEITYMTLGNSNVFERVK